MWLPSRVRARAGGMGNRRAAEAAHLLAAHCGAREVEVREAAQVGEACDARIGHLGLFEVEAREARQAHRDS
eukprot:4949284-Prymnesium_polylepis.1